MKPDYQAGDDIPIGLPNQVSNVCFFNSVVQMLNSLPTFQNRTLFLDSSYKAVDVVTNLIREINISEKFVQTFEYLRHIRLRNYVLGIQYDAHECLTQILGKSLF